jgi:hypothetical protein
MAKEEITMPNINTTNTDTQNNEWATPDQQDLNWLNDLFASIDQMDSDSFSQFLSETATFRFGNSPAVIGRANIAEAVAGFFSQIAGISHAINRCFAIEGGFCCEGQVSYQRHDGNTVTVPFSNFMMGPAKAIEEYLIFADLTPVFAQ